MTVFSRLIAPADSLRTLVAAVLFVTLLLSSSDAQEVAPANETDQAGIRVLTDQQYGENLDGYGVCDVYLPATKAPATGYPVVMIVHGGGWISGDKWTVEGYARVLAKAGYAAITINYRLSPKHKFPAPLDDVRQALVWCTANAKKFSWDCSRVGLFGYSAGGHLSLLAGLLSERPFDEVQPTTTWPKDDQRWSQMPSIKAVCAGGPPCDFRTLPLDNTALSYFLGGSRREKPQVYEVASPITHVSPKAPPVQLIHGDKDAMVSISNSQDMLKALTAAGVDARMKTIANQGHMLTFMNQLTSQTMLGFFDEVLRK
ncbi:alpha/beta hydrolase [Stieleria varia]|uniref:Carboxylesterase NlhH n=1 Tax=Stieleria varia TaxID=2528005 RepID=A0A5C6B2G0_9BACT|nr:alpha/beta hydrolase [Stieleria varia]TWU06333.1 Carboxylesterase NlhH [Stieleria varia]